MPRASGSTTSASRWAARRWGLFGPQRPMPSVKIANARSGGAPTRTLLRTGAGTIVLFILFIARFLRSFDFFGESLQRRVQDWIEPLAQRAETLRVDRVDASRALGAIRHQARVF